MADVEHISRKGSAVPISRQRLFRRDGSKVYGEEEHSERMEELVSELHEDMQREMRVRRPMLRIMSRKHSA
jgi:hypothetical protein